MTDVCYTTTVLAFYYSSLTCADDHQPTHDRKMTAAELADDDGAVTAVAMAVFPAKMTFFNFKKNDYSGSPPVTIVGRGCFFSAKNDDFPILK